MTSERKRKRGPVDFDSPRNGKAIKKPQFSTPNSKVEKHALDVTSEKSKNKAQVVTAKPAEEEKKKTKAVLPAESPKTQLVQNDSGEQVLQDEQAIQKERRKKEKMARRKQGLVVSKPRWKLSDAAGGRILNIDPVFAGNEKYVIVAHRLSLQVYSTSTSLLVRSIPLAVNQASKTSARIVAYCLSPNNDSFCWVACSDGAVFRVDWTTGTGATELWTTSSTGVIYMTAASMESVGRMRDVVFTTEARKEGGYRITAHELTRPGDTITTVCRTVFTADQKIHTMKAVANGEIIVAAAENKVLIGSLRSMDFDTVDNIKYLFRTFELSDRIASLDARIGKKDFTAMPPATPSRNRNATSNVLDLVVGDVRGVIFLYSDILDNLSKSGELSILPRKLHWHRKAVASVKWSLDGNYLISGGSENTLVLWQLDTGHKQLLPHLSATIQNIVVSPRGNSYAVHIDDNSTMVLSTSELTPTANFAGIQAPVIEMTKNPDSYVRRVDNQRSSAVSLNSTPAVIHPSDPSRLLLAVGETQEIGPEFSAVESAPYLQTFDIAKSQHVARQALARTNITNKNITPAGRRLVEPKTTHMQISHDGSWLATVDEWQRPNSDLELFSEDTAVAEFFKREVYLKFWQWNSEDQIWELVSRVDAPHTSRNGSSAGSVLDLAADPTSLKFSTIGEDGVVRIWHPRSRKRDNVIVRDKDGNPVRTWSCQNVVALRIAEIDAESVFEDFVKDSMEPTACLAYSEDSSVLGAAVGGGKTGDVYLIDPKTGSIRNTRHGHFGGDIVKMAILHKYLITLSDELRVYDLVEDELCCGLVASKTMRSLSSKQKQAMVHLAIDRTNQTFAVAIPRMWHSEGNKKEAANSHWAGTTEIDVFDPTNPTPLHTTCLPSMITSLLPSTSSPGYLVLDTFAEIRTLSPKAIQPVVVLDKRLSQAQNDVEDTPVADIMELAQEDEDMFQDERIVSALEVEEDDDEEFPVVTQQQLTEIFDVGPAFALPPIEELFYQVVDLFAPKPVTQGVS